MRRLPALAAAVCAAALGVSACGDDEEPAAEATATPTATATATERPTEAPEATGGSSSSGDEVDLEISEDTDSKPEIPRPEGDPPAELVTQDVVEGKGRTAESGSLLSMQYVGASWSTGQQFDASWDRGAEPITFPLGGGRVIPGWDQGIEGMKEGGRRLLVVPSALAYPNGTPDGSIAPGETLVFVVDLVSVD